jgi:hypothetical protein
MWKGAGSGYGHDFTPVSIPELVHWAGVPLCNGALDGKPATLFHRWKEHDPRYDPITAENIKLSRWRQIKRYFKLSMGIEEKKRGEAGYDPLHLSLPCTQHELFDRVRRLGWYDR